MMTVIIVAAVLPVAKSGERRKPTVSSLGRTAYRRPETVPDYAEGRNWMTSIRHLNRNKSRT